MPKNKPFCFRVLLGRRWPCIALCGADCCCGGDGLLCDAVHYNLNGAIYCPHSTLNRRAVDQIEMSIASPEKVLTLREGCPV